MPLTEEKKILKEVNNVKKIKSQVEAYNAVEKEIENIRQQLSNLRETHRETIGESELTETELARVKLANSLNCEVEDLTTKEVDCPKNRIGAVIGKNGSMIKYVEKLCQVQMNVNSQNDKISVTGGDDAVQRAVVEIDKIIQMQEEEIPIDESVCNYLSARDVKVLDQWRAEYPGVYMDTVRGTKKMTVRADPNQISLVKRKIQDLDIATEKLQLTAKQVALVVGKKGATIDKLCEDHKLSVLARKINADSSSVTFTGPADRVKAAMDEVDTLLSNHEDVETGIPVGPIMKQILLAENGRHMKGVQAKVRKGLGGGLGVMIYVAKDQSKKDSRAVFVKTKRSLHESAVDIAKTAIDSLRHLVVTMNVDPFVTPKIIGKSGETIRKLAPAVTTFLEVIDRDTGTISYGASTTEDRDKLGEELAKLIEENSILRVKADPETLRSQFRDLSRTKVKAELDKLAWSGVDEKESCFVLRGQKENLEKGRVLLEDFVANNYLATVPVTAEDIDGLLSGGKSSKIVEFSTEYDVKLSSDKENFLVVVKGAQEKVDSAKTALNRYLNGGDGFSVTKFSAGKVSGAIVGKGGKTRQELETKYGVSLAVTKAGHVTIRGPDQNVADCRVELEKLIATTRTSLAVDITNEQKDILERKEYEKRILQQIPVQISATDSKVTFGGTLADVSDAEAVLTEMLTGEYKALIELEPPQFARLRNATREPSHFERIASSTDASISLDLATGSISITGKRNNVKKAKEQLYVFLDFVLPGEIQRLSVSQPLQQSVGRASTLAEVSALSSGPIIVLDRDLSIIAVRSSDPEKVKKAASLLEEKITEAERLVFVLELSAQDAWIIPSIIGKNGNNAKALRSKFRRCKIEMSKETRTVTVSADTEEHVKEARMAIQQAVEQLRRETAFVTIPDKLIPKFVGKGGTKVKDFATEHSVEIQRLRKGEFNFRIMGDEEKVSAAELAIQEWISKAETSNADSSVKITLSKDDDDVGAVIGKKGATARAIEEEFGCKLDINTDKFVVTVRCNDDEKRQAAVDKVMSLVEADKEKRKRKPDLAKVAAAMKSDEEASSAENNAISSNAPLSLPQTNGDNGTTKNFSNPFPVYPVGVKPPTNEKATKKAKKQSGSSVQTKPPAPIPPRSDEGTEAGRNLFAMLVADD
jgi:predicted RNA-binding protein YlqC (UPF0109 family)